MFCFSIMVMVITMGLETRTSEEINDCYTNNSSDIMSNRELKKLTKKRDKIFLAVFFLILILLSVEFAIRCQRCNQVWRFIDCIIKSCKKVALSGMSKKVQITFLPTIFTFFLAFGKYFNFELWVCIYVSTLEI